MNAKLIAELFERDIKNLQKEILLYKKQEDLWKIEGGISNSGGTLCLHLIGNLNHFIGSVLGKTGFVREREKEFSDRNITREKITEQFDHAVKMVNDVLSRLSDEDLAKEFPIDFGGKKKTIQVLMILIAHFNYHLGQINYHRRLISA